MLHTRNVLCECLMAAMRVAPLRFLGVPVFEPLEYNQCSLILVLGLSCQLAPQEHVAATRSSHADHVWLHMMSAHVCFSSLCVQPTTPMDTSMSSGPHPTLVLERSTEWWRAGLRDPKALRAAMLRACVQCVRCVQCVGSGACCGARFPRGDGMARS